MTDKPYRLGVYARVSTKTQDVRPQLERLTQFADAEKMRIIYQEQEIASGRFVQRPKMEELMQLARGHHLDGIAVTKVDRWARSIQHLSTTVRELHDLHVDFFAVDQSLRVKRGDPSANLMLNILGAVAEWEAQIISERTKDGLVGKKGKGRHRVGCGKDFPCPSNRHDSKGMAKPRAKTR